MDGTNCTNATWNNGRHNNSDKPGTMRPLEDMQPCPQPPESESDGSENWWAIGVGITVALILVTCLCLYLFHRFSYVCQKSRAPTAPPRAKIKINANRMNIQPTDRRTLLKTANYTVEQSWDMISVKFNNNEFHESFFSALVARYPEINWDRPRKEQSARVTTMANKEVELQMFTESRLLTVAQTGNIAWVMNDFQIICKNLATLDRSSKSANPNSRHRTTLTPRLPTIGEELFDAGDYQVKICQTEVEIKFATQPGFERFKHALLYKYPTLPWSKYLQRDCAQIKTETGKSVTVHLWEEIRSLWVSGDGKKEWYANQFHEIYAESTAGKSLNYSLLTRVTTDSAPPDQNATTRRTSVTSIHAPPSAPSVISLKDVPANYTVKTLDVGGYEIEFPNTDFLDAIKALLDHRYPSLKWEEYSCRHVIRLPLDSHGHVTVHVGNTRTGVRKLWLYDEPGCRLWFNKEFQEIHCAAYNMLYGKEASSNSAKDENVAVAPIDSVTT